MDAHANKGAIAEAKVAAQLTEMGYICSLPVVHAARYDMILDFDSVMVRVQVKHAYEGANGKLRVDLRGKNSYKGKEPYKPHEVDAFAVYYDDTVYWFWFSETPDTGIKRDREWFESHRIEDKLNISANIQ